MLELGVLPFGIGPMELIIILVIVLLIVGPKRLPQCGPARPFPEIAESGFSRRGTAPAPEARRRPLVCLGQQVGTHGQAGEPDAG